MKKLLSYLHGREVLYLVLFCMLTYLQVTMSLKIPEAMRGITSMMQKGNGDLRALVSPAIDMLLCSLATVACAIGSGYFLAVASSTVIMRMREDFFDKVMSFSLVESKKFSTSSLITRATSDMEQVRTFISSGVQAIVQAPLMLIMAISKMSGNGTWMNAVSG